MTSAEYIRKCPDCGGTNLLIQKDKGEAICRDCGLVIEEKMIDLGQEWREFNEDQASKRRRTGAPMTWSVDSEEPIIIEENNEIRIVKIGHFIDSLMNANKRKIKLFENKFEILKLNSETRAVSFDEDYDISFRKITEVIRHPVEEVYEIITEAGRKVCVTESHSVFTVENNKVKEIKVSQIKEGTFLVAPKEMPELENFASELNLLNESKVIG